MKNALSDLVKGIKFKLVAGKEETAEYRSNILYSAVFC